LLQWAIWWASIMKRWSQVLENIECPRSKRPCTIPAASLAPHRATCFRMELMITAGYRLVTPPPTAESGGEQSYCRDFCA
jgi:hypothetical protein